MSRGAFAKLWGLILSFLDLVGRSSFGVEWPLSFRKSKPR